jgi:hypothetical protein
MGMGEDPGGLYNGYRVDFKLIYFRVEFCLWWCRIIVMKKVLILEI